MRRKYKYYEPYPNEYYGGGAGGPVPLKAIYSFRQFMIDKNGIRKYGYAI